MQIFILITATSGVIDDPQVFTDEAEAQHEYLTTLADLLGMDVPRSPDEAATLLGQWEDVVSDLATDVKLFPVEVR